MPASIININPLSGSFLRNSIRGLSIFLSAILDGKTPTKYLQQSRFDSALKEYSALIDRICFGYAKSTADLEDLRQDALLYLWESMPAFKGNCSMKTWVYRITLNSCVSSIRKSRNKISLVQLNELYDTVDYDEEEKEVIKDLHEAIGMLNALDKAIILLWLEGEEYEEISKITGVSKSNVAVRIHRAKEKLRTMVNI